MANCVHPSVLDSALEAEPGAAGRIGALQANTAALAPEELDGSTDLVTQDAESFADQIVDVARRRGLVVVGGCCGTDDRHIRAIAARLARLLPRAG